MKTLLTTISCSLLSFTVLAADSSADKSQYTIFNRTPDNLLRSLTSDEADRVISPYTVDAGHFQIESDLIRYYFGSDDLRFGNLSVRRETEQFAWVPRFKVGLCNNVDFETAVQYRTVATTYNFNFPPFRTHTSDSGFQDVVPKFKINLIGNDGGTFALAVAPYLSIPTSGAHVNGGAQLPLAVKLPEGFQLKITPEVFTFESSRNLYVGFDNDASISHSICDKLDAFANFTSEVTTQDGRDWLGYTGFGGIYSVTSNFQVYAGMRFGLTSNAYDYNPYLGLNWRF